MSSSAPRRNPTAGRRVVLISTDPVVGIFVRRGFERARSTEELQYCHTEKMAREYLLNCCRRDDLRAVILDLDSPRLDGLALLDTIRKSSELCQAKVFVISRDRSKQAAARALGIQGYVVRAKEPECLTTLADHLQNYWQAARRPRAARTRPS